MKPSHSFSEAFCLVRGQIYKDITLMEGKNANRVIVQHDVFLGKNHDALIL